MLRCRRCRKGIVDSTCLSMAQWTAGKLNCQNCGARLGGFNFTNRAECPCGRDATVHLNRSRVDRDHKHYFVIVQPRRTRPENERAGTPTDGPQSGDRRPEFNSTALDGVQLNCAAVMSHIVPAEASNSPTDSDTPESFSFSPLYCISHRRRCSLEDDSAIGACFCPVSPAVKSAVESTRTGTHGSTRPPVPHLASQRFDAASVDAVGGRRLVSGRTRRSRLGGQPLRTAEEVVSSPETTAAHQEVSASARLFRRGRSVSDSAAEQDQEVSQP